MLYLRSCSTAMQTSRSICNFLHIFVVVVFTRQRLPTVACVVDVNHTETGAVAPHQEPRHVQIHSCDDAAAYKPRFHALRDRHQ